MRVSSHRSEHAKGPGVCPVPEVRFVNASVKPACVKIRHEDVLIRIKEALK